MNHKKSGSTQKNTYSVIAVKWKSFFSPRWAFTMAEFLIVLVIMGVLAGIIIPVVMHTQEKKNEELFRSAFNSMLIGVNESSKKAADGKLTSNFCVEFLTLVNTLAASNGTNSCATSDLSINKPNFTTTNKVQFYGMEVPLQAGTTFKSIKPGLYHTCALGDTTSEAWCWGAGSFGPLGNGTTTNSSVPVPVTMPGVHTFTSISASYMHTCALDESGNAWCWGNAGHGTIGNGPPVANALVPVPVTMPVGHTFTSIDTSDYVNCALDEAGNAWCWGWGSFGQFGNGSVGYSYTPGPVTMPPGPAFTAISVGYQNVCALNVGGTKAWCWGEGGSGQLGNTDTADSLFPDEVTMPGGHTFTAISTGTDVACALDQDGNAWCWGGDGTGQLGNGPPLTNSSVPVEVTMPVGHTFTSISTSSNVVCALDESGNAWCWGWDDSGKLGNGAPLDNSSVPVDVTMPVGHTFISMFTGDLGTCALDEDKNGWCWGKNLYGALGNGTTTNSSIPVPVTMPGGGAPSIIVTVDVNGAKGPNDYGKDRFKITVNIDGTIVPGDGTIYVGGTQEVDIIKCFIRVLSIPSAGRNTAITVIETNTPMTNAQATTFVDSVINNNKPQEIFYPINYTQAMAIKAGIEALGGAVQWKYNNRIRALK